jgi:4-amino-4-deoxy-L-arabinose transferase-like glycosyltransferase
VQEDWCLNCFSDPTTPARLLAKPTSARDRTRLCAAGEGRLAAHWGGSPLIPTPRLANTLPGRKSGAPIPGAESEDFQSRKVGRAGGWLLAVPVAVAGVIFIGTMLAPPHLMDDVDGVQAQIARNMLTTGDWVTPRLNGIADFEKPPMLYWMIAASFWLFGVSDWAARIPVVVSAVVLCWLTAQIGAWAFGRKEGALAGICLATSVGLFLFSRVLFHDVPLTLSLTLAMWAALRALDSDEPRPTLWAFVFWAALAAGVLLKGLIALVLPLGALFVYLLLTRNLFQPSTWHRLRPGVGLAVLLLLAAPWHVLAVCRHPPFFDFSLKPEPGLYRGFFWFYFMNEHVLRFLNLRYPRDYTSIPVLQFLLLHIIWLFPWSAYLSSLRGLGYRGQDRASRTRFFALCWVGVVLGFFCISTTLEYYSLPAYPAVALLVGSALASGQNRPLRWCTRAVAVIAAVAFLSVVAILFVVRDVQTPGDIASALQQNPELYTMSLGHMRDLTIHSFAYLRGPLAMAGLAFLVGAASLFFTRIERSLVAVALMMILFFHAARSALIVFDPYMGSYPLAAALRKAPPGHLIVDDQYFAFSSVLFYSNRPANLLNGRTMNLEYGSYAPGAPQVFIGDADFRRLWLAGDRHYVVASNEAARRFESLVGKERLYLVAARGGKVLLTNLPLNTGTSSTHSEALLWDSGGTPDGLAATQIAAQ